MVITSHFTAVVLGGDRQANDPVAQAAGVSCKALSPIAGTAMIIRVINALETSSAVNSLMLCGPTKSAIDENDELQNGINSGRFSWIAHDTSPSASAHQAMASLPEDLPVLLTTADHALLTSSIVDYFCNEARKSGCDVVVGVALYSDIKAAYPGLKKTVLRFCDNDYCGCNLYGFLTPQGRTLADFWQRLEKQRKKPWRLIRILGCTAVIRYLLGTLSLEQALDSLSQRLNLRLGAVLLPFPEAAVDVDSVDDWLFVQRLVNKE
jgi:GTP:adenosylcobinamide-phosphate guanylyltransferase